MLRSRRLSQEPKRRRLRGELHSLRRLVPYMRPYLRGIIALVLVTLVYSGADAGRGALVMPLLNHILGKGSREGVRDEKWRADIEAHNADAEPWRVEALALLAEEKDSLLEAEDCDLGNPVITIGSPLEVRKDPLAQLLVRSRDQILASAAELAQPEESLWEKIRGSVHEFLGSTKPVAPDPKLPAVPTSKDDKRVKKLLKAIAYQRVATEHLRRDIVHQSETARACGAALSLEARKFATDSMFQGLWNELLWIFAAAIGLAFVTASSHFGMFYISRALVTRMVVDIQNKLAEHLLTLSIRYFNEERRGELFSRLTNDLSNTHAVLMLFLSDVLIQPFRLIVLAGAACWISWQLALSLLILAFTVIIPVKVWGKRIRRSARDRQASLANVLESMQQMFAGIRIVKAFRREQVPRPSASTRGPAITSTPRSAASGTARRPRAGWSS